MIGNDAGSGWLAVLARLPERLRPVLVVVPAAGLGLGFLVHISPYGSLAPSIWAAATVPVLAALLIEIVGSLSEGDVGLDIVAALSMGGALILGENLAAIVVAVMYAGGQYLETFAQRRAGRHLTALLAHVPRTAMLAADGRLAEVPLARIVPGDRILIRRGETVPVDGTVAEGAAVLDQSALTGEAIPVSRTVGQAVMSGSTNAGDAFYLAAERAAAESTYAGIVRLVEAAHRARAPMARLADRYALAFLGVTLALALAAWLGTEDPVRALAVLVVATPCPLILAVPVAIVSGVSRAAASGILVKGGRALEALASIRAAVIDKTGTLTYGHARLMECRQLSDMSETDILRMAASLDQASQHVIARALVAEAVERGLELLPPDGARERPGEGVTGSVAGRDVAVGGTKFVRSFLREGEAIPEERVRDVAATVAVAVDGRPVGLLILADLLREGAGELIRSLRELGIQRIVMATGDRQEVATATAVGLGLDGVYGGVSAERKIGIVREARALGPVMMVGDGVNDAPALAAADVGVAMGSQGAAAAEAADVVLLASEPLRIALAIRIARRSRAIALQSVVAGIGLSTVGMVAAALGYLTPVQGALLQEAIDVAVILNALRALRS